MDVPVVHSYAYTMFPHFPLIFLVPTFSVIVTPFSLLQGVAVGDSQDIQCTAEVTFNGVESSAVIFQWLGPEGIAIENDSRVTISPTNCFGNTFNSTLHFLYLMEGDDGMYTCNVMILRANESVSTELGRLNSKMYIITKFRCINIKFHYSSNSKCKC